MTSNGFSNGLGRGKSPTGVVRSEAEDAVIREMESRSRTVERRQETREETVIVESKMVEEGSRSVQCRLRESLTQDSKDTN
jgi:hypothetical protein